MASLPDNLSNFMSTLSMDDPLKELGLSDQVQSKLRTIENDYETIFSWKIKQQTGICQNLMVNFIDKIHEKCEIIIVEDDAFNLNRFYLKLITCYELYLSGSFEKSLLEIETVVKYMESCKLDESNEQYSDACNHIARTTYAYVATTLNRESEKVMNGVKPVNTLNRAEKAAICAVKARVFMEYPPKGNDIALKFADEARNYHTTEPEWIIIWLKAKGRVRRYYFQYKMPDIEEFNAAEILSTTKTKPRFLIQASKLFMEAGFIHKQNKNRNESNKFYKISSELTLKAIQLAKDDIKQLYSCLLICIDIPKEFHAKPVMDEMIFKLTNIKNSYVDQVLGKYYLKCEKDYEKAKTHLSRGMASGHFNSSLQLIKVECLLQPVDKFPVVKTLNMLYEVFPSPKRRLIILSQILLYYYYYENNPKELMHYLKLYLDQDIDDTFKKRHLIFAFPLFKVNGLFKNKQFLNILLVKVNGIKIQECSTEEHKVIEDTLKHFNEIAQIKMYGNEFVNYNKISHHKQSFDNNSSKRYPNKNSYNNNWQKQQANPPENNSNTQTMPSSCELPCSTGKSYNKSNWKNHDSNKNNHHPSFSKNFEQNNKHGALYKRSSVNQNKETEKNVEEKFNNHKSNQLHESKNNLKNVETKLKKFQTQYSSLNNLEFELIKNNPKFSRPSSCGVHDTVRDDIESNWQNRSKGSHSQDSRSFQNNNYHQNNTQRAKGKGNSNWRNQKDDESQSKDYHLFQNNSNRTRGGKNPNWQNQQSSFDSKRDTKFESQRSSDHRNTNKQNNNDDQKGHELNPILKFA